MGACLCCYGDGDQDDGYPSQYHNSNNVVVTNTPQQKAHSPWVQCRICRLNIDHSLISGHEETCRLNHFRIARGEKPCNNETNNTRWPIIGDATADSNNNAGQGIEAACLDENELCIICLENKRGVAFLPCGHVVACLDCAMKITDCPVCRQARTGLCRVRPFNLKDYVCKHCNAVIQPTFFDSHREVCASRQRSLNGADIPAPSGDDTIAEEQTSRSACDVTNQQERNDTNSMMLNNCAECGDTAERLVICLPCAHRVMCKKCASARLTCPVCLKDIRNVVVAFDS